MKKPLVLTLSSLLLLSCGQSSSSLSRIVYSSSASEKASESTYIPAESSSISSEYSSETSSSTAFIPPTTGDFISRYIERINSYRTYKAITKGSTKATVWFIETTQTIDVALIKNEYSYLKNESHSNLVNTVHEAYFHSGKALYRDDSSGGFILSELSTYLDAYGVYPFDPAVEGYLCGNENIKSVEQLEYADGYAFKVTFNPETSTNNVRIQMKAFGQLDDYPVFSAIAVNIYVKPHLTPDHLEVSADYTAKKVVDTNCHQEYRVDFSKFDEEVEVPNLETVKTEYDF